MHFSLSLSLSLPLAVSNEGYVNILTVKFGVAFVPCNSIWEVKCKESAREVRESEKNVWQGKEGVNICQCCSFGVYFFFRVVVLQWKRKRKRSKCTLLPVSSWVKSMVFAVCVWMSASAVTLTQWHKEANLVWHIWWYTFCLYFYQKLI